MVQELRFGRRPLQSSGPSLFVVLISRCRSSSCFRRDIWEMRARVRYPEADCELAGAALVLAQGSRGRQVSSRGWGGVPRAHAWFPAQQRGAAGPPAPEPSLREPFSAAKPSQARGRRLGSGGTGRTLARTGAGSRPGLSRARGGAAPGRASSKAAAVVPGYLCLQLTGGPAGQGGRAGPGERAGLWEGTHTRVLGGRARPLGSAGLWVLLPLGAGSPRDGSTGDQN